MKFSKRVSRLAIALLVISMGFSLRASAAPRSARLMLMHLVPQAKLDNVSLEESLNFIRDVTGANLVVDWAALQSANVDKQTEVNVSLRNVRLEKLLQIILREAAGGDTLTYYTDENIIFVTTKEIADSKLITLMYYVNDIIGPSQQFVPQAAGISAPSLSGGSATGGGGGSTGGGSVSVSVGQTNNTQTAVAAIITMIENNIRPEVWKDNGGASTIDFWNGYLIITAPRSVQEAIGGPIL
jgi:hypothetical protein